LVINESIAADIALDHVHLESINETESLCIIDLCRTLMLKRGLALECIMRHEVSLIQLLAGHLLIKAITKEI